ncbi:MAG: HAMP domain-containing histidine kinase [Chromatiaceae bacterium]|nr:HAMP domain-containing histidine kinase [Chromatiaceae bacterium]
MTQWAGTGRDPAHGWRRQSPLLVKLLIPTLLIGAPAWLLLDYIQTDRVNASLRENLMHMHLGNARENRSKLDTYLAKLDKVPAVFVQTEVFHQYIRQQETANWLDVHGTAPKLYRQDPPWLLRPSLRRVFGRALYAILLDGRLRAREIYAGPEANLPETFLEDEIIDQITSGEGESVLLEQGERPYLVSSSALADDQGNPRAFLALVQVLDENFLLTFAGHSFSRGTVAFLDETHGRVIASNRPDIVPAGMSIDELNDTYLVTATPLFDYSFTSEIDLAFASLMAWAEIDQLAGQVLASQRIHQIFIALVLLGAFTLILLWISHKMRRFSGDMIHYAQRRLGASPRKAECRDALFQLREQFEILCEEIDVARESDRRHSERLAEANERLKDLDRLKSLFIASVSHELRTPLHAIIGFTSILRNDAAGAGSERQRDFLDRVGSSANHLLALIDDLIDVSQVEAGLANPICETFDIDSIVAEAVEKTQGNANANGLALMVETPSDLQVHTDRRRILQCALNLLSNAVKYTEKGVIRISASAGDGTAEITITDTGIGIAEEDIPRLFQPFERLDTRLRVKAGGAGLGLYVTNKLASEVLGGGITVESVPGEGSTFRLRFATNLPSTRDMFCSEQSALLP